MIILCIKIMSEHSSVLGETYSWALYRLRYWKMPWPVMSSSEEVCQSTIAVSWDINIWCVTHSLMKIWCKFCEVYLFWVLRSTSVSHQCGPCSILGWGSDPSAVSEKGFVPVWATLCPWVGTLSRWPSLSIFTNPIQGTLKNSHTSRKE